jgi:dATP pyrophosphohydrolase
MYSIGEKKHEKMSSKRTVHSAQTVVYRILEDGSILILGLHKIASNRSLYWQSPRGGIEQNETPPDAALKETREETGIENPLKFIDLEHTHRFDYIKPDPQTGKQPVTTVIEYSFAVETDREDIVLSDEHTEYRWMTPDESMKVFDFEGNRQAVIRLLAVLSRDR